MAALYPSLQHSPVSSGQYREHEMLRLLSQSLPEGWRIYHGVKMSHFHEATQRYGELDAVVAAPSGHLAVLEIKAGSIDLTEQGAFKQYGAVKKSLHHQAHAQLHGLIGRLRDEQLGSVRVTHFLLLPDFQVTQGSVGYPRDRIIDASELESMSQRLIDATMQAPLDASQIDRLHAFLANRFDVVPDPACRHGQWLATTRRLADGLATWVPRIESPSGVYVVEATAGSGKTQLALGLLNEAASAGRRARYVCFNRPLADHMIRLAPPRAEVSTVHELAIDALRTSGDEPDFSSNITFEASMAALAVASEKAAASLDLLVVDESQDFDGEWLQALLPRLKPEGRLYVLGDSNQAIYAKEPFGFPEATRIVCHDNFRSPRRIVEAINHFRLTPHPVVAKGVEEGEGPELYQYTTADPGGLRKAAAIVDRLTRDGARLEDIAVLTFRGREKSLLLCEEQLGGFKLHRFSGTFDNAGNACWTEGRLLAESLYRFKGQSAPIVIVCEIDFETFSTAEARKLFVAMTRAQMQLHLVISENAEKALAARLQSDNP